MFSEFNRCFNIAKRIDYVEDCEEMFIFLYVYVMAWRHYSIPIWFIDHSVLELVNNIIWVVLCHNLHTDCKPYQFRYCTLKMYLENAGHNC